LLARALKSVYAQTLPPAAHLVIAQHPVPYNAHQPAVSAAYNQLLSAVTTEWTLRLDDDNYLLTWAMEFFLEASEGTNGVLGSEHGGRVPWGCTSMLRTSTLREFGGWPARWENNHLHHHVWDECLDTCEDQAMRQVAEHYGVKFTHTVQPVYVLDDSGHERLTDDVPPRSECPGKVRAPSFCS
jgi:hypothetical protein